MLQSKMLDKRVGNGRRSTRTKKQKEWLPNHKETITATNKPLKTHGRDASFLIWELGVS